MGRFLSPRRVCGLAIAALHMLSILAAVVAKDAVRHRCSNTALSFKPPITILFQTFQVLPPSLGGSMLDFLWLRDTLLAKLNRPVRFLENAPPTLFLNDSLVVVQYRPGDPLYFRRAREQGFRNIGVFHMGDEFADLPTDFYRDADYVFRNYYHERFDGDPHVHYLTLGLKSGVGVGNLVGLVPCS